MTEDGFASASGTGGGPQQRDHHPFWIVFAAITNGDVLGDQMFQYASSLGMMLSNSGGEFAKARQLRVCHFTVAPSEDGGDDRTSFHLADVLEGPLTSKCPGGVPAEACGDPNGCPLAHRERGYGVYTPLDLDAADGSKYTTGVLVGRSLQSHRYFAEYEDQLRDHMRLRPELRDWALLELKDLVGGGGGSGARDSAGVTTVGVDLRKTGTEGLDFPPREYLVEAMRRLKEQSKRDDPKGRVVFVLLVTDGVGVFIVPEAHVTGRGAIFDSLLDATTDIVFKYAKQGTNGQNVLDYGSSGHDLALLASCDHVVTTLGSSGWWGGWLSGGTVVYYRDQFNMDHPRHGGKVNPEDYFPPHWVGIGASELSVKE